MSAAARVAAALGARAEEVCRRYLPQGRKQGRYWTAGDVYGARGRSLFVRLAPPGVPGKWTDASSGEHGDLLDLIRISSGAGSLRAALAEAYAFLASPSVPSSAVPEDYDRTEAARRLWRRCRAIDGTHAEAYLRARGLARCRFAALRFHPGLFYRDGGGVRRLPALVAAVTGSDEARLRRAANVVAPDQARQGECEPPAQGAGPRARPCRPFRRSRRRHAAGRRGIETVLSIVAAIPNTVAAAALSAGSLGAFAPPAGVTRLVIARDNDAEGERAAERLARRSTQAGVAALVVRAHGR